MPTLQSLIKNRIDTWAPEAGRLYRQWRDDCSANSAPIPTPFGFVLAGSSTMAGGVFEQEEIQIFLTYLQGATVCIDIGANVGLYSCLAASQGKHVVAVEPLSRNLISLYNNLESNVFLDVEVYPLGLSNTPGIQRLYGGGTGASFISGWAGASKHYYNVVPVTTLDIIAGSRFNNQHLLIKMDVEGYEDDVLRGAQHILDLTPKPTWLVEISLTEHFPTGINDNFSDIFEKFWQHGYEARTADQAQRVVRVQDVERWVTNRAVDFGSHNYLFI
jgi:FkbM family methyltransferase